MLKFEAKGIAKAFTGPPIFRDVSLSGETGLIAVTGPNGSGKSTLLKIFAGLMRSSRGSIALWNDGARLSDGDRMLAIGFASPEELVPFGGEQAHKAFALALGLQLLVETCFGAVSILLWESPMPSSTSNTTTASPNAKAFPIHDGPRNVMGGPPSPPPRPKRRSKSMSMLSRPPRPGPP